MKMSLGKRLGWLSLGVALAALSARTQAPAQTIRAEQSNALKALSQYVVGPVDLTDRYLNELGYTPFVDAAEFARWPAIRKIEAAYLAAEQAELSKGGERFLAMMSKALAQEYRAARSEAALGSYIDVRDSPDTIRFAPPPQGKRVARAPHVEAIKVLSRYCAGGPLGSTDLVIERYFGLDASRAFEILRGSRSSEDALLTAFAEVPEAEREGKLRVLTRDVSKHYRSVRYETALARYLDVDSHGLAGMKGEPPPEGPKPGPPGGGGGGGGSGRGRPPEAGPRAQTRPAVPSGRPGGGGAAANYSRILSQYARSGSRSFRVMARGARGFGGVVMGNEVAAPGVPSAKRISFEGTAAAEGRLVVELSNGEKYNYPALAEDALAAHLIVFSGAGDVAGLEKGQGVGLVGIDDRTDYVRLGDTSILERGAYFRVALHPALVNTDLGWAILMVDVHPIEPTQLLAQIRKEAAAQGLPAELERYITRLFGSMNRKGNLGTWKVVDVPLRISTSGRDLRIARDGSDFPNAMREGNFLEMRVPRLSDADAKAIEGGEAVDEEGIDRRLQNYDEQFAKDFYRVLPTLTAHAYDYYRLNRFAAVLAIYRWAKQTGGTSAKPTGSTKTQPTPDAILFTAAGVKPIDPAEYGALRKQQLLAVKERIKTLERDTPDLQKQASDLDRIQGELQERIVAIALRDATSAAGSGSSTGEELIEQALRRAEADPQIKSLKERLDALQARLLRTESSRYWLELKEYEERLTPSPDLDN